jgi:arylsulfatase A-like enzyme
VERTLDEAAKSGKPWFVMWTPVAPHLPYKGLTTVPAPRHKGTRAGTPLYETPSRSWGRAALDTPDVQGKPTYVRERILSQPSSQNLAVEAWQAELEAVQAVDEWVGRLYDKLASLRALDTTDILFLSDNGLFYGEHGLGLKGLLYEEAAHLPLVARGPDFPAGAQVEQLALNIDLTSTVLGIARAKPDSVLDGRDLRPLARDPAKAADRAILLEYWYSFSTVTTQGLRLANWSYMRWSNGDTELYDLNTDPYQMRNVARDPAYAPVVAELVPRLDALATCSGASCEDSDASRSR